MDKRVVSTFLKGLRKEKGITQEQLAERMGVSSRTVSRWETGSNMPDLDVLIELADYYGVEIKEILDGERKDEKMNKDLKETVLKVADYSNEEKIRLTQRMHVLFLVGITAFAIYMVLEINGLADSGYTATIAGFALGLDCGLLILGAIYTSRYMSKIKAFKMRLLKRYAAHKAE